MLPRLLVSVRDATEAVAAIAGGCDILDVKEPFRGSLGMADLATMAEVVEAVNREECDTAVSVALGEVSAWRDVSPPALPAGVTFAKLGAAGLQLQADWRATWCGVRRRFEDSRSEPFSWIAVAYADWEAANSPPPGEIAMAAAETRCRGVLFDTFTKSGRGLLEWLPLAELAALVRDIRSDGQLVAFAGQIAMTELPALTALQPDIIAIRSAACANGDRSGAIDVEAVRRFKLAMSGEPIAT